MALNGIKKKFIGADQVDDSKILGRNNQYFRARNAADNADISIFKVNASDRIEFASLPQVTSDPSAANDLARKSWVESIVAGLRDPKDSVRLATAAALAAVTYANGSSGVGATLTADANGALSVDGVTAAVGDRILVKNQVAGLQNGIYVVTATGDGSNPFILTRATDADTAAEVTSGMFTWAIAGTDNARKGYLLTTADPIVVGTTALTLVETPIPSSAVTVAKKEVITLSGGDITNQYVDLAELAEVDSVHIQVQGVSVQEGDQYSLSTVGGVTRVTFLNDLATGGFSALIATDKLNIQYRY